MTALDLLTLALATWYLSYAITSTQGPGGVFEWLRENLPHGRRRKLLQSTPDGKERYHGVLDCPVCAAVWFAALFIGLRAVGLPIIEQVCAVAGAAMILHGWSNWRFNNG